jgi:uncharacterized protein (UPF0303 family)
MSLQDNIAAIIAQEKGLVFDAFDEATAFSIGSRLRERALREKFAIVADVRTWDRQMFFMGVPGTSADNATWVQRKVNLVRQRLKASYRAHLEAGGNEPPLSVVSGLDNADFVLRGGSFPIRVRGAGIIGAVTTSGLHERDDHQIVVEAIADELKLDKTLFALPPL